MLTRLVRAALATVSLALASAAHTTHYEAHKVMREALVPEQQVFHTVKHGETLWSIVAKDSTPSAESINALVARNPIPSLQVDSLGYNHGIVHAPDGIRGDYIYPGERLLLRTIPAHTIHYTAFSPVPRSTTSFPLLGFAAIGLGLALAPKTPPPYDPIDAYLGRYDTQQFMPVAAICERAGISRSMLYRQLRDRGLNGFRTRYRALERLQRTEQALSLYSKRIPLHEIAETLGLSRSTVRKYVTSS